ncbi:MAG: hypothetical protein NTW87_28915 [Planctomycetota bacterium]|nr:hypothetical protein [Planctomycetota bacterium]
MPRHIALAAALALLAAAANAETAKEILRAEAAGKNLLKPDAWQGLHGSKQEGAEFVCDNGADAKIERGFSQTLTLNQTSPLPIVASAWSKAENVGGSRDNDYSLYLDIIYTDGEPLWGQTAPFKIGSHDWQKGEVKVFPAKPIKQVSCHLLLRRHSGKAWFKEPRLAQLEAGGNVAWFDGLPVTIKARPANGFQVRDVAAGSDFVAFENGAALGLKLEVTERPVKDGQVAFAGSLRDTSGKDRAVTLVYSLPVAGDGWSWLAGPRQQVVAQAPREYLSATRFSAGANGLLSRYPFAAIAKGANGQAIVLDPACPAFSRVGFSAGANELYVAYDFGLTPERPAAGFAFRTSAFAGTEGFRGAVETLYALFPEQFRCRTPQQGLWMPFHKISKVEGWEDFGFKFKEGNDETEWDDAHGIITFRYTEPLTWWMTMPKGAPRTIEAALAEAKRLAAKGDKNAQTLLTSGYHNDDGQFAALMRHEPWCDGAVWSMNSSPGIAGDVTDFKNKWNAQLKDSLYGPKRKGDLDGEYVDSSEGYVTDELDFRREHFATAGSPLTFSTESHKPAVFRGLIAFEYVCGIGKDIHDMGKLMMANGAPDRLWWLAPWLDVMGTETNWNYGGKWRPMSDDDLLYRRVLCGTKPYCFLMNTNFEDFSHELVEKYMRRSLAYGMFPGFFSHNASEGHYFSQPKLYNRDRDLFKKYVPLCKLVAEAGWQPLTSAGSNDPKVYVERFGTKYLTVFNDSPERKDATITLAGPMKKAKCRELVSGKELPVADGQIKLTLESEDVAVLSLE